MLNQHSVVKGYKRGNGSFLFASTLVENNVGILQLQCPELLWKGYSREPLEYKDCDNIEYRKICRNLLENTLRELLDYVKNEVVFIGTVGIENSPSCSVTSQRGVLMEEFFQLLIENNLNTNYIEVEESYEEPRDLEKFRLQIMNFIKGEI